MFIEKILVPSTEFCCAEHLSIFKHNGIKKEEKENLSDAAPDWCVVLDTNKIW